MTAERKTKKKPRPLVGWREWATLPDLHVRSVKVKVDTGARTTALHATDVEVVRRAAGDRVRFRVFANEAHTRHTPVLDVPLVAERRVRSSNGQTELRPVIETRIAVGKLVWVAEVTLTSRSDMGFRMLLGRTALRGRFWVDAGRSFLQGTPAPPRDA